MRKLFWLITGLLTVAIATLVTAPSFIDWSQYKNIAQSEIKRLTGRNVEITGRVDIALWPKPALIAEGITLSGISGGQAPYIATLKSLEARVALVPLLSGQLKFESFKLFEPIIELERLADGRVNWELTVPQKGVKQKTKKLSSSNTANGHSGPKISLDHLTISNGTILYRDAAKQRIDKFEKINATVIATSLEGPVEAEGTMKFQGTPISYTISLGTIIQNRSAPFRAELSLNSDRLTANITGSVTRLSDAPQFKGRIDIKSEDVGFPMFPSGAVPLRIHTPTPLELNGQLLASSNELDIIDLRIKFLNVLAEGDLQVDLNGKPIFSSQLAIKKVDLDGLSSTFYGTPANNLQKLDNIKKAVTTKLNQPSKKVIKGQKVGGPNLVSLLRKIDGSAIITVDKLSYKSELVRNLLINMELKDNALLFRQVSAQIPGGSDILIEGQLVAKKNVPEFNGNVSGAVEDLPDMMTWLSIPMLEVPLRLPQRLSFKSKFSASPEEIRFTGLDINFDKSQLHGAVKVGRSERERWGLDIALTLKHFDVDAYFPLKTKATRLLKNEPIEGKNSKQITEPRIHERIKKFSNIISLLNSFDTNFHVHVKSSKFRGLPIKDLVAEGKLENGVLGFKRFNFRELAGATAKISGILGGLNSIPNARNIKFSIKIPDLRRHSRIYRTKVSPILKRLKGISLNGRLNGNLIAPDLDTFVTAAGAKITYRGQISAMPLTNFLNGRITLQHANLPKFLRRIGMTYRPAGEIGGINLSSDIVGGNNTIELSKLRGQIGKISAKGELSVQFASSKPLLKINLTTGAFNLENFLPTQNKAFIPGLAPVLLPASWQVPVMPIARNTRLMRLIAVKMWPKTPVSFSFFHNFDADISFNAPAIIYDRYLFEKVMIIAKNRNGVLNLSRFNTSLFGGSASGTGVASAKGNRITSSLRITGLDLETIFKTNSSKPIVNGKMNLNLDINSAGDSLSKIISTINGKANFTVTNINLDAARKGIIFSKLFKFLAQANASGNKVGKNTASMSGSFKIVQGIATTRDLNLTSTLSNAKATGNIHLPNKTIDFNGQLPIANNPLVKILKTKMREIGNSIPFAINGPWTNPRVRIDAQSAFDRGLLTPKADTLLKKTPTELRTILKGILGRVLKTQ